MGEGKTARTDDEEDEIMNEFRGRSTPAHRSLYSAAREPDYIYEQESLDYDGVVLLMQEWLDRNREAKQ